MRSLINAKFLASGVKVIWVPQRRCEALPTMHCDLGATLYIIDFSALVAHCSAGLRSVRRSVN